MSGAREGINFLLEPYRVLDLCDERGLLAGKILADLGADVIQIEPVSYTHLTLPTKA